MLESSLSICSIVFTLFSNIFLIKVRLFLSLLIDLVITFKLHFHGFHLLNYIRTAIFESKRTRLESQASRKNILPRTPMADSSIWSAHPLYWSHHLNRNHIFRLNSGGTYISKMKAIFVSKEEKYILKRPLMNSFRFNCSSLSSSRIVKILSPRTPGSWVN